MSEQDKFFSQHFSVPGTMWVGIDEASETQPSHTSRTAFLKLWVNELIPLLLQGALSSVDSMV
jgi:hypothetical protein